MRHKDQRFYAAGEFFRRDHAEDGAFDRLCVYHLGTVDGMDNLIIATGQMFVTFFSGKCCGVLQILMRIHREMPDERATRCRSAEIELPALDYPKIIDIWENKG